MAMETTPLLQHNQVTDMTDIYKLSLTSLCVEGAKWNDKKEEVASCLMHCNCCCSVWSTHCNSLLDTNLYPRTRY